MLKSLTTAKDLTVWLEGYLDSKESLNEEQVSKIRERLNSVFYHEIDPTMPDPDGELQKIHDNKPRISPGVHFIETTRDRRLKC